MSWQQYVDASLMGQGTLSQACIIDRTNASVWAQTPGFHLTAYKADITQEDGTSLSKDVNEGADIIDWINKKDLASSKSGPPSGNGFRVNGIKYITSRYFPKPGTTENPGALTVYGAKGQTKGICMSVCNKCIVIGKWDKTVNPAHAASDANTTVTALAKFLVEHGF